MSKVTTYIADKTCDRSLLDFKADQWRSYLRSYQHTLCNQSVGNRTALSVAREDDEICYILYYIIRHSKRTVKHPSGQETQQNTRREGKGTTEPRRHCSRVHFAKELSTLFSEHVYYDQKLFRPKMLLLLPI